MRILACYVNMHPETKLSLEDYAPEAELVYVGDDDTAYWHEISSRWNGEDDLMIVEQDNVIDKNVIPSFKDCPEPWCTFSYRGPVWNIRPKDQWEELKRLCPDIRYPADAVVWEAGLGCVRFRKELMLNVEHQMITKQPQLWTTIDARVSAMLGHIGYRPHVHGEVKHHHVNTDVWVKKISESRFEIKMIGVDGQLYPSQWSETGEAYFTIPQKVE